MRGLLPIVLFAACSGRDSTTAAGGAALTSIAATRTMGELSNDEKKQLCEDFKAFQKRTKPSEDESLRMMCQAQAAVTTLSAGSGEEAAMRTACKTQYDACVAKKERMPEPELDCNSPEFLGQMSVCKELTIGEISDCVQDLAGVMKKLAGEDLCGGLQVVKGGDPSTAILDKLKSAKCEILETRCKGKTEAAPLPELEKTTIVALTGLKTKMCACTDKTCAETVRQEMNVWGMKMAEKNPDFRPSPETAKQVTLIVNDYTNCMLKAAGDNSGSGSGSGSGSAK